MTYFKIEEYTLTISTGRANRGKHCIYIYILLQTSQYEAR